MKPMRCQRCKTKFEPIVRTQLYCSRRCKNRSAQERLRERAKAKTASA